VSWFEIPIIEKHLIGIECVPVLRKVLDLAFSVELENEAVDVSVGLAPQSSAVLGMLSHHIVTIGQHYYVGEPVGGEIIRVDACAFMRLARAIEDAFDRLNATVLRDALRPHRRRS